RLREAERAGQPLDEELVVRHLGAPGRLYVRDQLVQPHVAAFPETHAATLVSHAGPDQPWNEWMGLRTFSGALAQPRARGRGRRIASSIDHIRRLQLKQGDHMMTNDTPDLGIREKEHFSNEGGQDQELRRAQWKLLARSGPFDARPTDC